MRVIACGMVRSGSTWQYNALRIIMEHAGLDPICLWVNDYIGGNVDHKRNILIKTHEYKHNLVNNSIVFTAIRSEHDIKGSMRRRGEYLKENPDSRFNGTADPKRYDRYFRWYRQWKQHAHYVQQYHELKEIPEKVVNDHIKVLGLTGKVSPKEVLEELNNTKPTNEYNPLTMYHPKHITK